MKKNEYSKFGIVQIGDQLLRKKTEKLTPEEIKSSETQKIIKQMIDILDKLEGIGVGLAAPQIGKNKSVFIVKLHLTSKKGSKTDKKPEKRDKKYLVVINPKIINLSGQEKTLEEGCLSVEKYFGKVKRYDKVFIKATDENGKEFEYSATGVAAQIIQHEMDHLSGILFLDKAKELKIAEN